MKVITAVSELVIQEFARFAYKLDEMRFFVRKKTNPMWLAYAINKTTKEVAAFYLGKRNNRTLYMQL